jgi:hypothetical protein
MMLCDHAQVAEGKLFIAGGGWGLTGPQPAQSAVAILISVPWDRANSKISFSLRLLDQDGVPVEQPGPMGPVPVQVEGAFEVGRPAGLAPGTSLEVPLAFNVPPLPLPPARRFVWELSIDGDTQDDWHRSFSTRPAKPLESPGSSQEENSDSPDEPSL